MNKIKSTFLTASIVAGLSVSSSYASPWASPGDSTLRADVELLAHHGLISGPVNSWPMSWKQITSGFYKADAITLPAHVQRALDRVKDKVPNTVNGKAKASYTNQVQFFRGFEDEPRSELEIEGAVDFNLENTSLHVEGRYFDTDDFNMDNTYLSQDLGNWSLYAGSVERWWGPGQETTTLMSTNARPMPSIGLRRVTSKPFKTKWLSWMGPWDAEVFVSKMEKERHIPNTVFVGMRLNFEPIENFEIDLSRSLMLCGEGRVCGFKQWAHGLIGLFDLDNFADTPEDGINQPGNQLAQIAFSYSFNVGEQSHIKAYIEGTAEDLVAVIPYTYSRILGVTLTSPIGENGGKLNLNIEVSDTTGSLAWFYGEHRKGIMYNHHIYKTGYRYLNRTIGHSLDSNSKYLSLKATYTDGNEFEYSVKIQHININSEDNDRNILSQQKNEVNNLSANINIPTKLGLLRFSGGYMDKVPNITGIKHNVSINTSWQINY